MKRMEKITEERLRERIDCSKKIGDDVAKEDLLIYNELEIFRMGNNVNVDLETVRMINTFRSLINNTPLDKIVWWENGSVLDIDEKNVETFEMTGLANIDFINSDYYRRE